MVAFEWLQFEELRQMQNSKKPQNNHLWVENTTYGDYFVDSADNTSLLKTADNGVTVTTIDLSGLTVDANIVALFHDRVGERLYGINSAAGSYSVFYVDLTDDSVTEIRTASPGTLGVCDIYVTGGKLYFSFFVDIIGTDYIFITWAVVDTWIWTSPNQNLGAKAGIDMGFMTERSGVLYWLYKDGGSNVLIKKYIIATQAISTEKDLGATTALTGNRSQYGIAFDGDETLYFTLKDTGDGNKIKLWSYTITDATATKLEEMDVSLMLDRNNIGTAGSPWEFEKAFHISSSYTYQINRGYQYLLKLQDIGLTGGEIIIAISDTKLITDNSDLYKLIDSLDDFKMAVGTCRAWNVPLGNFSHQKQLSPDQLIEIYEFDDPDYELAFRGKLGRPEYIHENKTFNYISENLGWDDLEEEVSYDAVAEGIDEVVIALIGKLTDPYMWLDATSVPNIAINMTYNFNQIKLRDCLYVCAILANGYWWTEPNGYTYFRVYGDSPASGDAFSYANKNMTIPNLDILQVSHNDFHNIRGGMDLANGRPFIPTAGTATIPEHIQQYGKQLWRGKKIFSGARTQASLDAIITALKIWEGMVTNPIAVTFNAKDKFYYPVGYESTLTFEHNEALNFVPAKDVITIESYMDFKRIGYTRIIVSNNITRLI